MEANDQVTRYEYDDLGRRTATILPLNQRSTMSYDAVGNLQSLTDFNGETTIYRYDELNRLVEKDFEDDPSIHMSYTRTGQVKTIVDGRGTTQYEYDERDRLTKRIDPDGKWIEYGYDAASNRTSVTTSTGTTSYTFNERNWLDTVISTDGVMDYDYNAIGNLIHTQFANGTVETRRYDDLNRLIYLENKEADGDFISSYSYTLDKVGNRLSVTELDGRQVSYTYDELYRLTQEQILDVTSGNRTFGYVYDNVGNRLSKTDSVEGTTTYGYDWNDRLLSETMNGQVTTTYTYDDNGNTLTKTEPGQETHYTWDDQNRLVGADITTATGTKHLEYQYDTNGIRVASTADGQETRYLIDANQRYAQVLEEYTLDGTVLTTYVYGNDLISQTQTDSTTYYHVDGLGSTTALTNEVGNVVSGYRYDAFGETIKETGIVANKYLFAGEQFDENLGDYYLRARFYSPSNGNLISRDSWEGELLDPRTLHKYGYAANNPTTYIDPSGNSFMALFLEAPTIAYVTTAAVALTSYCSVVNSVDAAIALNTVASEAITAAAHMSSEILGAAVQALNILKAEVNEELKRRKNELDRWQLILQMPSGTTRKPENYVPPLGSSSFIVKQFEGDRMRVLGARLKQRSGPINELIARVDYHPLPREFPNHQYTLHYHLGPNSNQHRHYVIYPENRIID